MAPLVGREDLPAVHDEAAVDVDAIHILGRRVVDEVLHRIPQRRHAPRPALPQDEIGLRARRDAPQVVAPERPRAAEGGGVEDVGRRRRLRVALHRLREHRRPAHRLDHALGIGVRPERHVHAGLPVAGERLHRDAAAGEHPDRVGDRAARLSHDPDVAGRVIRPRRAADDDRVAEDRARPEEAQLGEPGHGRLPVAGQHLVELDHRLGRVERDRAAALVGRLLGRAQELRRARVDLGRGEAAADQAAVRAVDAVVKGEGPRQALTAALLVPLPVNAAAVLREPAPGAERESEVDPEPEVPGALGDVLAELPDLEHGRHAASEELGHGEVDTRPAGRLVLGAVAHRQRLEEARVVELGPAGVLDERPVERGARDVGVGRDQARA